MRNMDEIKIAKLTKEYLNLVARCRKVSCHGNCMMKAISSLQILKRPASWTGRGT